jgi:hypothetical protein
MLATHREYDDHELIALCRDPEAGLIHLRNLSCTHQKI